MPVRVLVCKRRVHVSCFPRCYDLRLAGASECKMGLGLWERLEFPLRATLANQASPAYVRRVDNSLPYQRTRVTDLNMLLNILPLQCQFLPLIDWG